MESSLRRHEANHLPASLIEAAEALELTAGTNLLKRVDRMVRRLEKLGDEIEAHGAGKDQLLVVRELRPSLELLGRVSGEIASNQINALFLDLGVSGPTEIRRALDVARSGRDAPLDAVLEDAIEAVKMCLARMPEKRDNVIARIGAGSYAEVVTNGDQRALQRHDANGREADRQGNGLRPDGDA